MLFHIIYSFCICLQVMHLEDYEEGAVLSNLTHGPYPLVIALMLLALDSMLYLLLAVYLDQVIPGMCVRTGKMQSIKTVFMFHF